MGTAATAHKITHALDDLARAVCLKRYALHGRLQVLQALAQGVGIQQAEVTIVLEHVE